MLLWDFVMKNEWALMLQMNPCIPVLFLLCYSISLFTFPFLSLFLFFLSPQKLSDIPCEIIKRIKIFSITLTACFFYSSCYSFSASMWYLSLLLLLLCYDSLLICIFCFSSFIYLFIIFLFTCFFCMHNIYNISF